MSRHTRLEIEVRKVEDGNLYNSSAPFTVLGTIMRIPWHEQIGNFGPLFCRYKGQRTLVHSEAGDLSDPFRRNAGYLAKLFIRVN